MNIIIVVDIQEHRLCSFIGQEHLFVIGVQYG